MGLANLTNKEFKQFKVILKFFETLGISEEDLRNIPKIKELLVNVDKTNNNYNISEEEKQKIKDKSQNAMTPEQLVEMFAGETEEFYPNGKPKQ